MRLAGAVWLNVDMVVNCWWRYLKSTGHQFELPCSLSFNLNDATVHTTTSRGSVKCGVWLLHYVKQVGGVLVDKWAKCLKVGEKFVELGRRLFQGGVALLRWVVGGERIGRRPWAPLRGAGIQFCIYGAM